MKYFILEEKMYSSGDDRTGLYLMKAENKEEVERKWHGWYSSTDEELEEWIKNDILVHESSSGNIFELVNIQRIIKKDYEFLKTFIQEFVRWG